MGEPTPCLLSPCSPPSLSSSSRLRLLSPLVAPFVAVVGLKGVAAGLRPTAKIVAASSSRVFCATASPRFFFASSFPRAILFSFSVSSTRQRFLSHYSISWCTRLRSAVINSPSSWCSAAGGEALVPLCSSLVASFICFDGIVVL